MTPLQGHDGAVAAFLAGIAAGRIHHAWLISGPRGIGKALFADKAALRLLAGGAGPPVGADAFDVPDDHPSARLVAAGSHPDLMRLERLAKDSGELARNINVDQVRGLRKLFATTATFSPHRVVVIDAADDLERAAANALLKNLEEPPPGSLFLLVSHTPDRLLPTIRSRCRHVRLQLLDAAEITAALRTALPAAGADEIATLTAAGEGAPGRALALHGLDIAGLDAAMADLAAGDATNAKRARLAQSLAGKPAQPRYEAFLARAPGFIAAQAKQRTGAPLGEAVALWDRANDLTGSAIGLSLDPQTVTFELGGIIAQLADQRPTGRG